jgi:sugar O-acyltransferase (sialic acid O-acetyltransferase NeuD family)
MEKEKEKPSSLKVAIIGAGGQARETYAVLRLYEEKDENIEFVGFYESLTTKTEFLGFPVKHLSEYDPDLNYHIAIAIGDGNVRKSIVESLPESTQYIGIIHPSAVLGLNVEIGKGSFVGQGVIVTENVKIGKFSNLNIGSSISHDVKIGDYFTASPGSRVLGGCEIGERVYLGAASILRDKKSICDETFVGMGSVVVSDIKTAGVYYGNPARKKE